MIDINEMVGRVFVSVTRDARDEELCFTDADGRWVKFMHFNDCCERVQIEDVIGDLSDLVGTPILHAEEVSSADAPAPDGADSYTWTFYKFDTIKGSVTVRWLGESNGYYSEAVSIISSEKPESWR